MFNQFEEFDLALALYHWLQHNWEGRNDELYSAFCQLTAPGMFKLSYSDQYFDNIDEITNDIYDLLTITNYKEALNRVLNYESENEYA